MSHSLDSVESSNNGNIDLALSPASSQWVQLWKEKVRGGFASFPIVFDSADGHIITDVDGKKYIDMISQLAVMNFGYSHPKIVDAAVEQTRKLPMCNTTFINPLYAKLADRLTKKFGFDSMTTMLSGAEAVDAAVKIARKWAYIKKGILQNEAWVLTADCCYHGVTLTTMALSNVISDNFGEHVPKIGPFAPDTGKLIEYGDLDILRETFGQSADRIAAFMIEPIQGVAGTRIPPKNYLKSVQDLCHKHNILFICDEVQTGYGRTGTDLAFQHEPGVKPDLVVLGKAVTGGIYPMSVVLGKKHVMDLVKTFDVAGTFAGSPIACAAALAAVDVLEEECIAERAQRLGETFASAIDQADLPYVVEHRGRGRGMFQTFVVDETISPKITARRIAALCALRGVLVGNGANRLRFSPPLVISEADLLRAVQVIQSAFRDVADLGDFPGSDILN